MIFFLFAERIQRLVKHVDELLVVAAKGSFTVGR